MASNVSQLQDLSTVGDEAIRALVAAIAPEAVRDGGKLSPEAIQRLTDKIGELVGSDKIGGLDGTENGVGNFVNEEGLPIVDITEPVEESERTNPLAEEKDLVSVSTLSPSARQQWQQERDRILDLLEQEEELEHVKNRQKAIETSQEMLEKRKEAAAAERERLKATKEMQKKMGKALIQNVVKAKEVEEKIREEIQQADVERKAQSATKKTVKFVGISEEDGGDGETENALFEDRVDWGDVTPARLRAAARPTLVSRSHDTLPMKMAVVERIPTGKPPIPDAPSQVHDSDDESEPPSSPPSERVNNHSDEGQSGVDTDLEEGEIDLDFAQHQREIALEYHKKRTQIGEAASQVMNSHTHEEDEYIPEDVLITETQPKPTISKFRATRIASAYNASAPNSIPLEGSTSMENIALPASTARTLQRAIRTGKLEGDRLISADAGDSESDEELQGAQEILELLKKGEIYNLGPDGNHPKLDPSSASPIPRPQKDFPPPKTANPSASRFKVSRSQLGRALPQPAPKPAAQGPTPNSAAVGTHIVERRAPPGKPGPAQSIPVVIDSPSFQRPQSAGASTPSASFPMIIESPSFPPRASGHSQPRTARLDRPPAILASSVKESRSTPQASSPLEGQGNEPPRRVSRFMADRM